MDPKYLAILGAGVIGAGALIIMGGSSQAVQPGGGSSGTKKEGAIATGPLDPGTGAPIYNITFEAPGGFGSFGSIPDPVDTIGDVIAPGDPARRVYASTYMPGYKQPDPPTKKEQKKAERGFTSRTGGGAGDIWIGGR